MHWMNSMNNGVQECNILMIQFVRTFMSLYLRNYLSQHVKIHMLLCVDYMLTKNVKRLVPARDVHFLYACSRYMVSQNGHANIIAQVLLFSKTKYTSIQFTCWIVYWAIFIYLLFVVPFFKRCVCIGFRLFSFSPTLNFPFLHLKKAHNFERNICIGR